VDEFIARVVVRMKNSRREVVGEWASEEGLDDVYATARCGYCRFQHRDGAING